MTFSRNVLTLTEAADLLGISRQRVHIFIKKGRLQAHKVHAGHNPTSWRRALLLLSRASVLKLKAKREKGTKP